MMKKEFGLLMASAVLFYAASGSAIAGDIEAGKAKSVTCIACHGANGISPTELYPNLAGQKVAYMVKQMKAFKQGARQDPTMSAMMAPLTEKDMTNIAAYYASLK